MAYSKSAYALWAYNGLQLPAPNNLPGFADGAGNYIGGGYNNFGAGFYKVDPTGAILWSTLNATQGTLMGAAPDRAGGAIAVSLFGAMQVARVSSTGSILWGPLTVASDPTSPLAIASDGAGNSFVFWRDNRAGAGNLQLFVQKLSPTGVPQWIANGVVVENVTGVQTIASLSVCGDESGGCYLAWEDYRAGVVGTSDLYMQHVSSGGTALWTANGIAVCNAAGRQQAQTLASDGAGGVIVAWVDQRGADSDIYAQRVNTSGTALWTSNGVALCTAPLNQGALVLVSDGSGGVFAAWSDDRNGCQDIFAQRVNSSGTILWAANGAQVATGTLCQKGPSMAYDGAGGVFIAWGGDEGVAGQHLDGNGNPLWILNGVRPIVVGASAGLGAVAPDGTGGAYMELGSQLGRSLASGESSWAANYRAQSLSVADVLADEGGWVQLGFNKPIVEGTSYSLWRKRPGSIGSGPARLLDPRGILPRELDPAGITSTPSVASHLTGYTDFPAGTWDAFAYLPALQFSSYTVLAPTHTDSTALGSADESYVVVAHTQSPGLLVPSFGATGRSVDNLAPGPPQNVSGGQVGGTSVVIHWSANPENDLWHYAVYKGTSPSFVPSPTNRIGQPTNASIQDDAFEPGVSHYKVSAIDRHSNESIFTLLSPSQITSVPPGTIPARTYLGLPVPNPFHGAIALEYGLARGGAVAISIYDLRGRRIARLVDGAQPAGVWRAVWKGSDERGKPLPSGVYLARFSAEGITKVAKIVMTD
jgi:hypothetical protein